MIVGHDPDLVSERQRQQKSILESHGLPVHEVVNCSTNVDYVGLHFDGDSHEISLSWNRIWRLRLGIQHALKISRMSGKQLERLVGHITWAMLLRRESLSILSSVYAFTHAFYNSPQPLWNSVRRELRQVAALLPLLVSNFGQLWGNFAADLSTNRQKLPQNCPTWYI